MINEDVKLELLEESDKNQFVLDNQRAFRYGAMEEFGLRDNHFEEDGEIISRATIEKAIDSGIAYRIVLRGKKVGGVVIRIDGNIGELELLFVNPEEHTKGIGQGAWFLIEKKYPQIKIWETMTPYFEKRNIYFYVNKCGFKIVEFLCDKHPFMEPEADVYDAAEDQFDGMFRFIKELV